MTINWTNPYAAPSGNWFKGNLHSHSTPGSPCSAVPLSDLIGEYHAQGYDFLSVSDHMIATRTESNGMTLLPGLEWNSRIGFMPNGSVTYQDHLGVYGTYDFLERCIPFKKRDEVLHAAADQKCFIVANHPNWTEHGHYDFSALLQIAGRIHGIEIYNAIVESEEGEAYALAEWDRLLAAGHRVLGLASDDSHHVDHVGHAWIMVDAVDSSAASLHEAIRKGRFYCSTGVTVSCVERRGDVVSVVVGEEARIDVIGHAGRLLDRHVGKEASFDFSGSDTSYVRFQIVDREWGQAWTQPLFRD